MNQSSIPAVLLCCALLPRVALADDETGEDKSHYTLFNPTPRPEMREWRTDHAGVSPYTIDAGHFEIDVTAVSYAYQNIPLSPFGSPISEFQIESWTFGETVLKAGLLNSLDLEGGIIPYQQITETPARSYLPRVTGEGLGDTFARLKWNIWGNDGGKTALSASGTVTFPTADKVFVNGGYRGGPSLEFAAQLPWEFELRIDSGASLYHDNRNDMQAIVFNLLSLSRRIAGNLSGYAMFSTYLDTVDAVVGVSNGGATFVRISTDWVGSVKTGLNFRIGKDVELFAGSYFGVQGLAPDYNPFVGIGVRF